MRKEQSGLILGLFVLLLVNSPVVAQSFGPAAWIQQSWTGGPQGPPRVNIRDLIPIDITVGPGEEVFVTGQLWSREAYFEASASDSPDIRVLANPSQGFLARYDGENGDLIFVQPGSVLLGVGSVAVWDYSVGYSVAVVDGRLLHGEGLGLQEPWRTGSSMITVRNLEGSVLHRIGPRERYPLWYSVFIKGQKFDAQGNLYMAGTYNDTLYFSPDIVLAPSRSYHHATWDVFVASYAPDGTVRWARQVEAGTGDLWVSLGGFSRAVFDMDAEGNMVLGAVAYGVPPDEFSAAEDGVVLAYYDSDGTLHRIRTLKDLGISYRPSFDELLHDLGPLTRAFAGDYVPYPKGIRYDKSGNLYALWSKWVEDTRTNSVALSDTTFYDRGQNNMVVLTKYDAWGELLWARSLECDHVLWPRGMEITEEGHVYVWGVFRGRYVSFEGIELTQDEPLAYDSFVAHYDENGNFVRAMHLQAVGSGYQYVDALAIGPSGDVYIAGGYTGEMAALGADTLHARAERNMFVARYSVTPQSSEPAVEVPSEMIELSNYPNPFADATTITYGLPAATRVRLAVYDLLGRRMTVLVDEERNAGSHTAVLDASAWPDGIYVYRLEVGEQFTTGSLVHRK